MEEIEFDDFFQIYIKVFGEEYQELLKSDEFMEAQNELVTTLSSIFQHSEKMVEDVLSLYPVLPFAPRSEIDDLEKRVHDYRRKINRLEGELRQLRGRLERLEREVGSGKGGE